MDRRSKRPSDGESSGSSKRREVEEQTSKGFGLGPAGRDHLRFTNMRQRQELAELHKIVSNLEEVELIDNPQAHYAEKAFFFPQDNPQKLREIEGHASGGFASGSAEKRHMLFKDGGHEEEEERTKQRVKEGKIALIEDELNEVHKAKEYLSVDKYDKIVNYYEKRLRDLKKD